MRTEQYGLPLQRDLIDWEVRELKLQRGHFYGSTLTSATVNGFTFTEKRYQPGTRLPKHSHELPHFCLTVAGSYTEEVLGKEAEHHPAALTFCPPDFEHSELHHSNGRHFVIEVDAPLFYSIDSRGSIFGEPKIIDDGISAGLAAQLYREFQEDDRFTKMALEGIALELLANSARRESRKLRPSGRQDRLDRVLELLHQSFPTLPALGTLAEAVGIHPVYLATSFRKTQGCTIGEYVRRLRIKHACSRIVSSNDPLVQIALEAGFTDQTHLSKSFKRVTGMTPALYRKTFRAD